MKDKYYLCNKFKCGCENVKECDRQEFKENVCSKCPYCRTTWVDED